MKILKAGTFLVAAAALSSCSSRRWGKESLQTYDDNAKYQLEKVNGGYMVTVLHSHYSFMPEEHTTKDKCVDLGREIAKEEAMKEGAFASGPMTEWPMKLEFGRSMLSGSNTCHFKGFFAVTALEKATEMERQREASRLEIKNSEFLGLRRRSR